VEDKGQGTEPARCGNTSCLLKQGSGSKRLVDKILGNLEKKMEVYACCSETFQEQHADKAWGITSLTFKKI